MTVAADALAAMLDGFDVADGGGEYNPPPSPSRVPGDGQHMHERMRTQ
jgi:hypothetical protein